MSQPSLLFVPLCIPVDLLTLQYFAVSDGLFNIVVQVGIGDAIGFASGGEFPGLTIDDLNGCLTVNGDEICAKYSGSIESEGIAITSCDISTLAGSCGCTICADQQSVTFNCAPDFPELTTNGMCASPAFIF